MYRAVDVLGFAGGFTLGVVQAGFELVGKRELPGGFGVANCEANRHLLGDRWHSEARDPRTWSVPDQGADFVFGNPPCSGFSVMSAKDFRGADSKINACMWSFADYVSRVRPQVAVFESVQQARNRPDGLALMRALRERVEDATGLKWDLHHVRHNAYHVGGAAQRRRYFWVVSRVPFGIEPSVPSRYPMFREVISDLSGLTPTWESQAYRRPPTWWSKERRSDTGAVDGMVGARSPLIRRCQDLAAAVGWYPGESISDVCRRAYKANGHLPPSFAATEDKIVRNDFRMGFTTPVRWHGDRPGRVITGGSLVMVLHPDEDRMVTHREAARVLGFPDDWLIQPLRGVSGLQMTWGKGITVDCGRWIAQWVRAALDENPGSYRGVPIGDREYDIDVTHGLPTTPGRVGIVTKTTNRGSKMSETVVAPPVDETAETTSTPSTEESKRGRGRPDNTLQRDAAAREILNEAGAKGSTRDELAVSLSAKLATDVSPSEAYLSLYRLNKNEELAKVRSGGKPRWVLKAFAEEAEAAALAEQEQIKADREKAAAERAEKKAAEKAAAEAAGAENAETTPTEAPTPPVEDVA